MTDRIRKLTVILDRDYRDGAEDVDIIIQGIRMIKGVSIVEKGDVVDYEHHAARDQYNRDMGWMISELATSRDGEFVSDVKSAYAKLKEKRGY